MLNTIRFRAASFPFLRVGKSSLWQDIGYIQASHANSVIGHSVIDIEAVG
jgi:hypothetical protein